MNQLYIHIYPLPLEPPHPHHTHLGHHGAPSWAPCVIQQLPTICFTNGSAHSEVKVSQSCPTLCNPMDYTMVHGILQARILEWVAFPFARGSSQPRDWTQVSRIADVFFTSWATGEVQEYWSGCLIPSSAGLSDPGINPGSPALQADSLPTELSGKPLAVYICQS